MSFTRRQTTFGKLSNDGQLSGGLALDLGCGKGADALFLAENGFIVDAVDSSKENLASLESEKNLNVKIFAVPIENFSILKNNYDLIIASFSLQFLSKELAKNTLTSMMDGTKKGGIVFFNLIGPKDEWAQNGKWSTWNKEEIFGFLDSRGVTIRNYKEEAGLGDTISKGIKYWHIFEFVLVKK